MSPAVGTPATVTSIACCNGQNVAEQFEKPRAMISTPIPTRLLPESCVVRVWCLKVTPATELVYALTRASD